MHFSDVSFCIAVCGKQALWAAQDFFATVTRMATGEKKNNKSQHHHIASPVPNPYNIAMVSALVKAGLESCNM